MATTYVDTSVRPAIQARATFATASSRHSASRKLSVTLWTLQGLLAVIFLLAGSMKLLSPADMLEAQTPLPILLIRCIGVCEVAGALGMLLPGLRLAPLRGRR